MDSKKWYQSKAVWAAVTMTLIGGTEAVSSALGHPVIIPQWIKEVLIGMGIYGVRTGDKPIS